MKKKNPVNEHFTMWKANNCIVKSAIIWEPRKTLAEMSFSSKYLLMSSTSSCTITRNIGISRSPTLCRHKWCKITTYVTCSNPKTLAYGLTTPWTPWVGCSWLFCKTGGWVGQWLLHMNNDVGALSNSLHFYQILLLIVVQCWAVSLKFSWSSK